MNYDPCFIGGIVLLVLVGIGIWTVGKPEK
jgi:hypothetical protein